MRKIVFLLVICLGLYALMQIFTNMYHEKKAVEAYSRLVEGLKGDEVDKIFANVKLIKKQILREYRRTDVEKLNNILKAKMRQEFFPDNLSKKLILSGEIEVNNYLIKKRLNLPYGFVIEYISIFKDKKTNAIIGWGKGSSWAEVRTWGDSL